jgi:hypothetical protein
MSGKKFYITNKNNKKDEELYNNYTQCKLNDIDDCEAEHLLLDNYLEYNKYNNLFEIFTTCVKKIQKKGKLTILGNDSYVIAKEYFQQRLSLDEYNQLVYNGGKLSSLSLHELVRMSEKIDGIKIVTKCLELRTFIFEVERD